MNATDKVFLDPNFIYYLVDRGESFQSVFQGLKNRFTLCTDVKCLQEVVYRYHLNGETQKGYERALDIRKAVEVFSVGAEELEDLDLLLESYPRHIPRELLHVAVMQRNQVRKVICSPESAYHEIAGIEALKPVTQVSDRY